MRNTSTRGRLTLLFMAFAMMLALPATALADDIYNNLDGSIDANVETIGLTAAGSNGNVNLQVNPTGGDGKGGCNLTGSSALSASVDSSDPSVATANPSSITFTSCGDVKALAVTPLKAGETTISLRQTSNTTGGTFNLAPASFKVVVAPAAPTQKDTSLSVSTASGTYGGTTSLSATLSSSSTGVSGKSVDFTLNGNAVGNATTNSSGVATLTGVSLAGIDAGTHHGAVVANFAGDTGYKASLGSNAITVDKAQASLSLSGLGGHTYNGQTRDATVATNPTGLSGVTVTYDGNQTRPTNAGSYSVVASLDNPNYRAQDATGTMVIDKANPQITWSNPAATTYGTALGAEQLNADADVAGSFNYTPASGTKLDAGANQNLKADFEPSDPGNYNGASKTVQITVNKANQTVDFGALANKTFGDADFELSASSDSGLDVSFASTTPAKCSVSNGSVSILEAGTCTITASQGGNANYNAARSVSQSFDIAKKTASITLGDLNHTYDGQAKAASVTTTPDGLKVDLAYNKDGQTVAEPINAGSYKVVATINSANYQGSKEGTLSIAKASQSIDFGVLTDKTFGDADFNVSATGGNSGNDVTFSANGDCVVQDGTVSITGAGSCTITASQAGNANYAAAADVSRSFAIAKAEASVSLGSLSKTYNGQAQVATVTTTPAGLSGVSVTYDGNAQAPTDAGSYEVVANLSNANYRAEDATGTLVIAKAQARVDLSNLRQTYDGTVKTASASTAPTGLKVDFAYGQNGGAATPRNAGSYDVVGKVNDANYEGQATGTLVIDKARAGIDLSNLNQVYNGSPRAVTVGTTPDVPNKQITVTYDGNSQAPTNAGSYRVVASLNDANYVAEDATGTLVVDKAQARVDLGGLSKTYNGSPQVITPTTDPANLNVSITYDGNAQAPTNAGNYQVAATVDEANYKGSANGTLVVAKARQAITFAPLATKTLGDPDFTVSARGGDSGSPVTFAAAGSCTVSGTTVRITGVGNCDITASQAGNANYLDAAPVKQSFGVNYRFAGYRQPVDNNSVLNTAKAGSAIPMKFSLSGNQGLNIIAAGYPKVTAIACAAGTASDAIEELATTNSGLTYDATADQYNYVWKTQSTYAGKCFKFDMVLTDGTSHTALFKFTK